MASTATGTSGTGEETPCLHGIADILLLSRNGGGRKKGHRKWLEQRTDAELEEIYKMTRVHLRHIK